MTRQEFDLKISKVHSGSQVHDVCLEYIDSLESYITALKKELKANVKINISLAEEIVNFETVITCDGCLDYPSNGYMFPASCGKCNRFYKDFYKPKEI